MIRFFFCIPMLTILFVTPFATTLDYYSFDNWVSIMGYQSDSNWLGGPTSAFWVKYEIVTTLNGSVQWYGQKTVPGFYFTGSQYYEIINLNTISITTAKVRLSSNGNQVSGAGNVYEN